jgi:hypothetical protein
MADDAAVLTFVIDQLHLGDADFVVCTGTFLDGRGSTKGTANGQISYVIGAMHVREDSCDCHPKSENPEIRCKSTLRRIFGAQSVPSMRAAASGFEHRSSGGFRLE